MNINQTSILFVSLLFVIYIYIYTYQINLINWKGYDNALYRIVLPIVAWILHIVAGSQIIARYFERNRKRLLTIEEIVNGGSWNP
jgi:hypothetical protein